jgi:hypothetical protein
VKGQIQFWLELPLQALGPLLAASLIRSSESPLVKH